MKVIVFVKLYFHKNGSGGEAYLHHFLKRLKKERNLDIQVLLPDSKEIKKLEFEGITIHETTETVETCLSYIDTCNLLISQLDNSQISLDYALKKNIPSLMIFHNSIGIYNKYIENPNIIKIFNSNFVMNDYIKRDLIPVNKYLIYLSV